MKQISKEQQNELEEISIQLRKMMLSVEHASPIVALVRNARKLVNDALECSYWMEGTDSTDEGGNEQDSDRPEQE